MGYHDFVYKHWQQKPIQTIFGLENTDIFSFLKLNKNNTRATHMWSSVMMVGISYGTPNT